MKTGLWPLSTSTPGTGALLTVFLCMWLERIPLCLPKWSSVGHSHAFFMRIAGVMSRIHPDRQSADPRNRETTDAGDCSTVGESWFADALMQLAKQAVLEAWYKTAVGSGHQRSWPGHQAEGPSLASREPKINAAKQCNPRHHGRVKRVQTLQR